LQLAEKYLTDNQDLLLAASCLLPADFEHLSL
jgi:hypothetical protein